MQIGKYKNENMHWLKQLRKSEEECCFQRKDKYDNKLRENCFLYISNFDDDRRKNGNNKEKKRNKLV